MNDFILYITRWRIGRPYLAPQRYIEIPWALNQLRALRPLRVADVGSGDSPLPLLMAQTFGAAVLCVDPFDSVEEQKKFLPYLTRGAIEIVRAPFSRETVPGAPFDAITCISTIEHPPEGEEQLLAAMTLLLRPGGLLVVTCPCAREYREVWSSEPVYGSPGPVLASRIYGYAELPARFARGRPLVPVASEFWWRPADDDRYPWRRRRPWGSLDELRVARRFRRRPMPRDVEEEGLACLTYRRGGEDEATGGGASADRG